MSKPVITVPSTPAPTELQIEDLTDEPEIPPLPAKRSRSTTLELPGQRARNLMHPGTGVRPFRSFWGGRQVIRGWDDGVQGMRVGGRRKLTIPPDMGYGARGAGGAIKPNETLIFVVDLISVG